MRRLGHPDQYIQNSAGLLFCLQSGKIWQYNADVFIFDPESGKKISKGIYISYFGKYYR
jgi:hypothetical protein